MFAARSLQKAIYGKDSLSGTIQTGAQNNYRKAFPVSSKLQRFHQRVRALGEFFSQIPDDEPTGQGQGSVPYWSNIYLPPGDAIALCAFMVKYNPVIYMEIGSGNSTKFARRAVSHFNLRTKIISIDPHPRAEIDTLCDEIVREPLQMVPVSLFKALHKDNILFVDGSHRCLQNSDVTYTFLEVLPTIRPGVLLHFHDIFWPYDYPAEWAERSYNEQYLLGTLLLFGSGYEILYPSSYVGSDPELRSAFEAVLRPFLPGRCMCEGGSFWMKMNMPISSGQAEKTL